MDDDMTVSEAAQELGMSVSALRTRLERGHMQGRRVHPRLWFIPRAEIERAKAEGRLKPGPKGPRKGKRGPAPSNTSEAKEEA